MVLIGYVKDKNGKFIDKADIYLKDENFNDLYTATTDENGYYELNVPDRSYPFFVAVKDYAQKNLEFWGQNIPVCEKIQIDAEIDELEIYAMHAFIEKGGLPTIFIYFRPMALKKFKQGLSDICPDIKNIQVFTDGKECSVLRINKVSKYLKGKKGEESPCTSYLIEVEREKKDLWKRIDVKIWDNEDHIGNAVLFNN